MNIAMTGGEMPSDKSVNQRDTFLVNLWLNNTETLYQQMFSIMMMFTSQENREINISKLVERAIDQEIITDKINLWLVDWAKIVEWNSGDNLHGND